MRVEKTIYKPIPPATYPAEIIKVEQTEAEKSKYDGPPPLRVTFQIYAPGSEQHNQTVNSLVSPVWSEKSKMNKLIQACGIKPIEEGAVETDHFIGKHLLIQIEAKVSGDTTYSNVTAFTALPAGFSWQGITAAPANAPATPTASATPTAPVAPVAPVAPAAPVTADGQLNISGGDEFE